VVRHVPLARMLVAEPSIPFGHCWRSTLSGSGDDVAARSQIVRDRDWQIESNPQTAKDLDVVKVGSAAARQSAACGVRKGAG